VEMEYEEIDYEEVMTIRRVAKEVFLGYWGIGVNRDKMLTEAGYDADAVNEELIRLLNIFK